MVPWVRGFQTFSPQSPKLQWFYAFILTIICKPYNLKVLKMLFVFWKASGIPPLSLTWPSLWEPLPRPCLLAISTALLALYVWTLLFFFNRFNAHAPGQMQRHPEHYQDCVSAPSQSMVPSGDTPPHFTTASIVGPNLIQSSAEYWTSRYSTGTSLQKMSAYGQSCQNLPSQFFFFFHKSVLLVNLYICH